MGIDIDHINNPRVRAFCLQYGHEESVMSRDGRNWLFLSGAVLGVGKDPVMREPPNEYTYRWMSKEQAKLAAKSERLRLQYEYHASRLHWLVEEFGNLKRQCMSGHYSDEQLRKLKKLQQAVSSCRKQLADAEKEREESPTNARKQALAQVEQQRRERIAAVESIDI